MPEHIRENRQEKGRAISDPAFVVLTDQLCLLTGFDPVSLNVTAFQGAIQAVTIIDAAY